MPDNIKPDGDTAPADFLRSTDDEAAQEVGSDTLSVSDVVFGQAPSAKLPFWKAAALQSQANFSQNLDGAIFARQNNAPLKAGVENQTEEEKLEKLRDGIAFVTAEEKRQQEREAWATATHRFAGASLTGKQWGELGAELQNDGPLKEWLIKRLMKNGNSQDDAEKKAQEITDITLILGKPESERTAAEIEQVKHGLQNTELKEIMPELAEQKVSGTYGLSDEKALHSVQPQSVATGDRDFASAPDLSQHHAAASVAIKPLDTPKPLSVGSTPSAPEPSMGGLG